MISSVRHSEKRKGLHTISGNSNHLYRNSKPDRLTWLQTTDKGYERHRSTRCNEYSSYRGGRNQGKGHQRWLKSFAEPMPVILPINILEIFIKPLSLCMRLFGNVLGSFVIMELLKMVVPAIVPAVFSCYFDIFDGLIQAYVFVFLTGLFIKEATE